MKITQIIRKATKGTFGEVLQNQPLRYSLLNHKKPAGFDILETKFTNELKELNKFFRNEIRNGHSNIVSIEEVKKLMEKYVSEGLPLAGAKQLTPNQRKLIATAYAKAGKLQPIRKCTVDSADRAKLGLLINRNWPFLKYISETNGAKLIQDNNSTWTVDSDEIDSDKCPPSNPKLQLDVANGNFKAMLKNLNKVHQTQMIHVLPKMTQFQASPTIKNVKIGEEEIKDIEHFLHNAKHTLDSREQDLFKAKINYELTSSMIQKHPKTFALGNFFNPVCIPGSLIEINEKQISKINTKQLSLKKGMNKVEQMRLYLNGKGEVTTEFNTAPWCGKISNIYQIIGNLKKPQLFQSQMNKFVRSGWTPVKSTSNEIIFVRDKKEHQLILIKRGTLVGLFGFILAIGVFGINM
ncbi:hypothetical protein CANINC_001801 [Pichia inconspicua]|uniref:Uncharacterized protein n=1 Tax=Pichia inconspicua TaxID=52247 RepID=A0A4T0X2Y0_9ASCO|nr:hypothetical protein CANINC_001801 [[Candida] inconspicua]